MKGTLWLLCALIGSWLLLGGPVSLIFGVAVGVGLVLVAGLLLLDDVMGPRR